MLDSGASHHMTHLLSLLEEVRKIEKSFNVIVPTGQSVLVEKIGNIQLNDNIKLINVLYIPSFNCNLIFVHKLIKDLNCLVTYDLNSCHIQDQTSKKRIRSGELLDGVYVIKIAKKGVSLAATTTKDQTILWHARMGHPSNQCLQYLSNLIKCSFNFNSVGRCDI